MPQVQSMSVVGRPGLYLRSAWLFLKATTAHKLNICRDRPDRLGYRIHRLAPMHQTLSLASQSPFATLARRCATGNNPSAAHVALIRRHEWFHFYRQAGLAAAVSLWGLAISRKYQSIYSQFSPQISPHGTSLSQSWGTSVRRRMTPDFC